EGEDIKFYITICGSNDNAGTIRFYLDWSYSNLPAGALSLPVTAQLDLAANPGLDPTDGTPIYTDVGCTLDGSNFVIGTTLDLAVRRVPGDDSYGSDVLLQSTSMHTPKNGLGSRQEIIR
ncbi:unnamed protein product, partial [marine sediment metagenome]